MIKLLVKIIILLQLKNLFSKDKTISISWSII
jgi:hypothetical protein